MSDRLFHKARNRSNFETVRSFDTMDMIIAGVLIALGLMALALTVFMIVVTFRGLC